MPKLEVHPTYIDASQLADAIAERTLHLQRDRSLDHFVLVTMSAVMGSVAGLVIATWAVMMIELSKV